MNAEDPSTESAQKLAAAGTSLAACCCCKTSYGTPFNARGISLIARQTSGAFHFLLLYGVACILDDASRVTSTNAPAPPVHSFARARLDPMARASPRQQQKHAHPVRLSDAPTTALGRGVLAVTSARFQTALAGPCSPSSRKSTRARLHAGDAFSNGCELWSDEFCFGSDVASHKGEVTLVLIQSRGRRSAGPALCPLSIAASPPRMRACVCVCVCMGIAHFQRASIVQRVYGRRREMGSREAVQPHRSWLMTRSIA